MHAHALDSRNMCLVQGEYQKLAQLVHRKGDQGLRIKCWPCNTDARMIQVAV